MCVYTMNYSNVFIPRHVIGGDLRVDLDKIRSQAGVVHCFQCNEVVTGGFLIPSYLVLTEKHVIKLRDVKKSPGEVLLYFE